MKNQPYKKHVNGASMEWILNLIDTIPKSELRQQNMRPLQARHLSRLMECDPIIQSTIYTYSLQQGKFCPREFILYSNMLLELPEGFTKTESQQTQMKQQAQKIDQNTLMKSSLLVLSSVLLDKKVICYKEFMAQGLILTNEAGYTYLFFETALQTMMWIKYLKGFCKLTGFSNRYTIREKLPVDHHYVCVKNKSSKLYTVKIVSQSELATNQPLLDALMNEVNILMCHKHKGQLPYHAVYEDSKKIYIVYEYWTGETLFKIIQSGASLTPQQIASIVHQVVKVSKFLIHHGLYHGYLLPQNIVILRQSEQTNTLQVAVINMAYRDANTTNYGWLMNKLPTNWVPPELQGCKSNDRPGSIDLSLIDIYQIGCLLYYLTFYAPRSLSKHQRSKQRILSELEIDYKQLERSQTKYSEQRHPDMAQIDKRVTSQSQLSLMLTLLNPDPLQRQDINVIAKHPWFINTCIKKNPKKAFGQKIFQSLRTILEIREQSSYDMNSSSRQLESQLQYLDEVLSDSENEVETKNLQDNLHRICKEDCKLSSYVSFLNSTNFLTTASRKQENQVSKHQTMNPTSQTKI